MKTIHLHGSLGKKYGKTFKVSADTPQAACKFLASQIPGLKNDLREGLFRVVNGDRKTGMQLGSEDILLQITNEVHITPVVAGSKNGGVGKVVIGALLIGAAFVLTGGAAAGFVVGSLAQGTLGLTLAGNIALFGTAVALSGVAMMLSPMPKSDYSEDGSSESKTDSFLFQGVQNTTSQGGPVPLIYGTFLTGSKVISASLVIEDMAVSDGVSTDGSYGSVDGEVL